MLHSFKKFASVLERVLRRRGFLWTHANRLEKLSLASAPFCRTKQKQIRTRWTPVGLGKKCQETTNLGPTVGNPQKTRLYDLWRMNRASDQRGREARHSGYSVTTGPEEQT